MINGTQDDHQQGKCQVSRKCRTIAISCDSDTDPMLVIHRKTSVRVSYFACPVGTLKWEGGGGEGAVWCQCLFTLV